MANQITIDIGAAANDGTGDPLRTAFNYVNNNFSNVWNTGLPNSNVQFSDNRILTVNTNANLVLAPNGIGKVASNVDIVPNTANVFSLGGTARRWNTVYGQYLDLSHNATIGGNLTVTGNITGGNIHYTGNVFVGDLEGSVFDGASSIVLDVIDSSIYVDNYYYANGVPFSGGSGNYGNANVAAYLPTYTGNISAGNAAITNLTSSNLVNGRTGTFTGDQYSDGAMYIGSPAGTVLGSDVVIQITANAGGYSQTNFQNINSGATASSDYILTADNGNNTSRYLDLGITSSGWDGSETNVLANLVANNGYLYVQDGNLTLGTRNGNTSYTWNFDTSGNLTVAGNVVPTGNNTQSLGSATRQWNDLYLSNATIYMNSVPISLTAGNVLTVDGADVVTTNSDGQANIGNLAIYGSSITLASGALETIISISPNGESQAYLQIPDNATANVANVRMHNDAGNIEFGTGSGSYNWYFDNNGTLTIPGDITSDGTFAIDSGDDIRISGGDQLPDSAVGEGGDVTIFGGTGRLDNGTSTGSGGDVRINAGDGGDGTLSGAGAGGYAEVQGGSGGAANVVNNIQAGEGGYVIIQGGQGGDNLGNIALSGIGGNVDIYGGAGSADDGNSTISGAPGHVNLYGGNWGFVTPSGNIYLNTYDGSNFKTLTYDNHGNVTMAAGGGLNFVGSNPGIVQSPDEDFTIRVQDADDDGFAVIQQVDDGAGSVLGSTELQRDLFTIAFAGGSAPQFRFNEAGQTEIPGNIRATEYVDTSLYSVSNDGGAGTVELKVISYAGDVLGSNVRVSQSNATISTNNAQYTWNFDNTGILTAPGNIATTGNISVGNILAQNIRTIEGTVHVGQGAGLTNQGTYAIAMGRFAGSQTQGGAGVAVGQLAGQIDQGQSAVAIGLYAAANTQGNNAVAVGTYAGQITQGVAAIAIGNQAGNSAQGSQAIAIGTVAGQSNQGTDAVAIGSSAGGFNQSEGAVAIGQSAGVIDQGLYAVAIGSGAGYQYQANNSIAITATGTQLSPEESGFYVDPVRNDVANIGEVAFYNTNTKEFTYGNTISVAGNLTGGNIITGGLLSVTASAGDEGGEIRLAAPQSNTVISGNIVIDAYRSQVRFLESGGTNRGLYVDIASCPAGQSAIGYRDIPQIVFSGDVQVSPTDSGKHYYNGTNTDYTVSLIDSGAVTYPVGMAVTIVNQGTGNIAVEAFPGVSLYMAGSSSAGNRTVGAYGMATVLNVATDVWMINGTGVY